MNLPEEHFRVESMALGEIDLWWPLSAKGSAKAIGRQRWPD